MMAALSAEAELAALREQFPAEPLKWLPQTPRIAFQEGMRLLQEAGFEVCACAFAAARPCSAPKQGHLVRGPSLHLLAAEHHTRAISGLKP